MRADLRWALRSLAAGPTFTVVSVVVLALGIGATAAIFAVVDTTLLRPLPYHEPHRLVVLREHRPADDPRNRYSIAPQNFLDWDADQRVFDALAALSGVLATTTAAAGEPADVQVVRATADVFDVLRVPPSRGRLFRSDEEVEGRHRVAVVSDGYWRRRFGAMPDALGQTLPLDGEPYEIVGVLPPLGHVPGARTETDVYVPLVVPGHERTRTAGVSSSYLTVLGRLRTGTTLAMAQAEMDGIAARLRAAHPDWNGDSYVRVVPAAADVVGAEWSSWLWMILGGAACVLLIACVNVAVLQLTRANAREQEMSVRAVLGGGRGRLVRQLLAEHVLLSLVGCAAALVVAWWGVAMLRTVLVGLPRVAEVSLDARVLAVMAVAATGCGVLVAIVPAWYLTSTRVARALHDGGRTVAGRSRRIVSRALVVTEVALAVVLLVAASLWTRSLLGVLAIEPGFETAGLLTASVSPDVGRRLTGMSMTTGARPAEAGRARDAAPRLRELADRLGVLPGVTAAAFVAGGMPLGSATLRMGLSLPDHPTDAEISVITRFVTEEYFRVLGVAVSAGRDLATSDRHRAVPPAIVNDAFVLTHFGGESPLGRTVTLSTGDYEVVGVVPDIRGARVDEPIQPELTALFTPAAGRARGQLLIRAAGDPRDVVPAIRRVAAEVFPGVPLRAVQSMDDVLARQSQWRRLDMWVVNLFAALGGVIAAVGLFGTLAYGVARRTREIGVRMALGATASDVVRLVGVETAALLGAGLLAGGVVASWVLARYEDQWFGVTLRESGPFLNAAVVMTGAALAAAMVPVRRALRVDPVDALRRD